MSVDFDVKVVLCDIEGTTTSIYFVKNILFPYSQTQLKNFLNCNWENSKVRDTVLHLLELIDSEQIEGGCAFLKKIAEKEEYLNCVANVINILIKKDYKIPLLKVLQGLIWEIGYKEGKLKGHVFSDVPDAFKIWTSVGIQIFIYSSGSEHAQKLLYAHSEYGNLLQYISGHFDTKIGAKIDRESYSKIIENLGCCVEDVIFLTDIPKEAHAAKAAGLNVVLLERPGNAMLTEEDKKYFPSVSSFTDINLKLLHQN